MRQTSRISTRTMAAYRNTWLDVILVVCLCYLHLCGTLVTATELNNVRDTDPNGIDNTGTTNSSGETKPYSRNLPEDEFLARLVREYGTDGLLTVEQVANVVKKIRLNILKDKSKHSELDVQKSTRTSQRSETSSVDKSNSRSQSQDDHKGQSLPSSTLPYENCTSNCATATQCLSMEEIFLQHRLLPGAAANSSKLQRMSPTILYQLQNSHCHIRHKPPRHTLRSKPDQLQVWGYGFLFVTVINLCSLMGMVFLPLMRRSFYHRMLMFMVALAVGTLAGSGLLFLIPESFEMTRPESEYNDTYVWKSLTILGGIYLFFLVERVLKMIMKVRQDVPIPENTSGSNQDLLEEKTLSELPMASVPTHSVHLEESMNMSFKPPPANVQGDAAVGRHLLENESSATLNDMAITTLDSDRPTSNGTQASGEPARNGKAGHHSHHAEDQPIRSIAWMVIFGDGLHNFIDGLSIGAAFAGNILTGISVSLAVICEELPHELGDFAILLNSGMTVRQALGYNFLSACMCYGGLVIGILVGGTSTGAVWIFAVAGGMFLYISLVDMLPEVNHAAEEEEKLTGAMWSVFFIQNVGLLSGGGIMVLLAYFGGQIDLSHLDV